MNVIISFIFFVYIQASLYSSGGGGFSLDTQSWCSSSGLGVCVVSVGNRWRGGESHTVMHVIR